HTLAGSTTWSSTEMILGNSFIAPSSAARGGAARLGRRRAAGVGRGRRTAPSRTEGCHLHAGIEAPLVREEVGGHRTGKRERPYVRSTAGAGAGHAPVGPDRRPHAAA